MALGDLRGEGRGWTLLSIAVGWVFVLGGRFLVPAVLPQVKDAFTVGDIGAGVAVTVIWATYGLMQMPAGILVDRVGERRLLAGSVVLTATSVVVIGGAPAFFAFPRRLRWVRSRNRSLWSGTRHRPLASVSGPRRHCHWRDAGGRLGRFGRVAAGGRLAGQ
jgi:hypothetical protein